MHVDGTTIYLINLYFGFLRIAHYFCMLHDDPDRSLYVRAAYVSLSSLVRTVCWKTKWWALHHCGGETCYSIPYYCSTVYTVYRQQQQTSRIQQFDVIRRGKKGSSLLAMKTKAMTVRSGKGGRMSLLLICDPRSWVTTIYNTGGRQERRAKIINGK